MRKPWSFIEVSSTFLLPNHLPKKNDSTAVMPNPDMSTSKRTSFEMNSMTIARISRLHARALRGSVLIVVLITIVILSLSAYTFTALMQTEEQAARLMTRRIQSKYLVDSGVDYARLYLSEPNEVIREKGGLWDNYAKFQAIPVAAESANPNLIGYFSIITSNLDEEGNPEGYRFGLADESSKLNLNVLPFTDNWLPNAGRQLLMSLPEMDEEIADAILDFIDSDDEERDFGTESSYYSTLAPPYAAKNGPLDSLDELLLVRGVTPQLMFGLDANRNGILDDDEAVGDDVSGVEADMKLGWANYMTLYSNESNLNSEGLPRVNINADDLEQLYDDLKSAYNDEWANYIIFFRTAEDEPQFEPPDEVSAVIQSAAFFPIDFELLESKRKFTNILDLVDSFVKVDDPENLNSYVRSPIRSPYQSSIQETNWATALPTAMANLTTFEGATIPGRINIMQAPRRVLEGVPGFDEEIVEDIIRLREYELDDPDFLDQNRKYETWLMVELIVEPTTMRTLIPFICTGGDVYRAEVVGYFSDGSGTSRAEVVLDTTVPVPRILFWRDKSHLQGGFSIDTLGTNLVE
jgi:hypothetical protein